MVESQTMYACVICGKPTMGNGHWFLLAANRWQDKLRILEWNDLLASQAGIRHACSASHVQEMVVHWMTTGSVDYPFAEVTVRRSRHPLRRQSPSPLGPHPETPEVDIRNTHAIGELSVHRESMQRILRESPESLSSILDALLSALNRNQGVSEQQTEVEEEELCGVGRQV
jgi:hypothetical protein